MKTRAAFSVERCKELERTLNHDVIAFTTNVAENIGAPASRWLHFGLTSSDVVDTAFAVQMVQSADILIEDVKALRKVIAARAREHQFTPMIGRSHGIHAEPTTFGLKLALMHDEFGRALQRLEAARNDCGRRGSSPARSAPARISRRASRRSYARSSACAPRRLPPRWCSATCTRSSSARWPWSAPASNAGPPSSATSSAPKSWRRRSSLPKARRGRAPCRTSATRSPASGSAAWPACCAAMPSPPWKTSPSGTSATSATARSSASSSPTPARCSTTCSSP